MGTEKTEYIECYPFLAQPLLYDCVVCFGQLVTIHAGIPVCFKFSYTSIDNYLHSKYQANLHNTKIYSGFYANCTTYFVVEKKYFY